MSAPRIPWPGGKRIPHIKQLGTGSRTATTDCGPCADLHALQGASGAAIRIPRHLQAEWIDALRDQMTHGPTWPATRLSDQRTALLSGFTRGAFLEAGGLRRPVSGVLIAKHDDIIRWLIQGRTLVVAVSYAAVNDLMPSLSGSSTFRGGHAISLQGLERDRSVAWTRLGDSLHDGRRKGVPRGWQTVRVRRYLRAAEAWGSPRVGKGRAAVLWLSPAEELR